MKNLCLMLMLACFIASCGDKAWHEATDEEGIVTFTCIEGECDPNNTFLNTAPVSQSSNQRFNVKDWGGWISDSGSCLSTMEQFLIRTSQIEPTLTSDGCRVVAGQWYVDNQRISLRKNLRVAHIVPPFWAFKHGARAWSAKEKSAFFNDKENLILLSKSESRQRKNQGPSKWLPGISDKRCYYLKSWSELVEGYNLTSLTENQYIESSLKNCR